MLTIFAATYIAVFVAEIVGDKLLYTTGVLATRYRSASIVWGMAAAFMIKMGVAVAVGTAISQLPRALVAVVTGASTAEATDALVGIGVRDYMAVLVAAEDYTQGKPAPEPYARDLTSST